MQLTHSEEIATVRVTRNEYFIKMNYKDIIIQAGLNLTEGQEQKLRLALASWTEDKIGRNIGRGVCHKGCEEKRASGFECIHDLKDNVNDRIRAKVREDLGIEEGTVYY